MVPVRLAGELLVQVQRARAARVPRNVLTSDRHNL